MEIWKPIDAAPGYSVSTEGRVRNDKFNRLRATATHQKGYKQVQLRVNKKPKVFLVHRLVAVAFIPNPDNLPEVNHKDGDKTNCSVDNLEWCSNSENQIHRYRTLGKRGDPSRRSYKPIVCVDTGVVYDGLVFAAEALGLSSQKISDCLRGKNKTAGGLRWEYVSESSRPSRVPSKRKTVIVKAEVTPEEQKLIKARAKESGTSVAAYLRMKALDETDSTALVDALLKCIDEHAKVSKSVTDVATRAVAAKVVYGREIRTMLDGIARIESMMNDLLRTATKELTGGERHGDLGEHHD